MYKKLLAMSAITTLLLLALAACGGKPGVSAGGSTTGSSGAIRPVVVTPEVNGDSVLISTGDLESRQNLLFKATVGGNTETFMAYTYGGTNYVRASVCPPCRSQSFSLYKNTLVCNACGTVFDAKSGEGKSGACVNYPKAGVNFTVSDGNLVMATADLAMAFQNTLNPGLP